LTGEPDVVMIDGVHYSPTVESEPEGNPFTVSDRVEEFRNGTALSGFTANSKIASLLGDRQNILLAVGLLIAADYFALLSHVSALTSVC
jgi:hypothetical protein